MDLATSFQIIGISPEADANQARQAYKRLVRRWHPDQFPEGSAAKAHAEEQLKRINVAYARIKPYLSTRRPAASPDADAKPAPAAPANDASDQKPTSGSDPQRSWMDHLFDTLNNFRGQTNGVPAPDSASDLPPRRRSFKQVLDEIAGNTGAPGHATADRPTGDPRRPVAVAGRGGSSSVDSIGGTRRVEPIKPVGRVRGIGKDR